GAVMGGAALGAGPLALAAPASAAEATPAAFGPATVAPDDPRYASLVRGTNHRFVGTPDHVRLVGSTAQVVDAVNEAVAAGRRIAVRSGGHCFENFTASPEVRVLVDLSELNEVRYGPWLRAFSIQAGATLGHVYRTLFKGWGVTVPAGITPEVGVGGHFAGGGYGAFSRRLGSVVDYLYAVEVVTVDASGRARAVLATKRADDPHRDLWWAHTGGGGGNFGVVTKYWVRSPGATGGDPATALPKAPSHSRTGILMWPWSALDQSSFTAVL